jgi:CheY-like chemotaxis protein
MNAAANWCRPSVLVVEDEILISNMIGDALVDGGFAVHAVTTAEDAMRYLSSGLPVDVLFTDINLPGRMDGSMLAESARILRPDLPVVFASGQWTLFEQLRAVHAPSCCRSRTVHCWRSR